MIGSNIDEVASLYRARPRNHPARLAMFLIAGITLLAWVTGGIIDTATFTSRRIENIARFTREAIPEPLRIDQGFTGLVTWVIDLIDEPGAYALYVTLLVSTAAILLAQALALPLSLLASRCLCTGTPFGIGGKPPPLHQRLGWWLVRSLVRTVMAVCRSIPAYMWAFLLIGVLGIGAWPAVLALAIHNAGVLARLDAEVFEAHPPSASASLRVNGASRHQIAIASLLPGGFTQLLALLFYRAETCIRESTVIGLVGLTTIGYWVRDARARNRYDIMLFLMSLTVLLVVFVELCSYATRRWVR